jgi:hypothetical protein
MEVLPPSKSRNGDRSVFFDFLNLKPQQDTTEPVYFIGSKKEEVVVNINDT